MAARARGLTLLWLVALLWSPAVLTASTMSNATCAQAVLSLLRYDAERHVQRIRAGSAESAESAEQEPRRLCVAAVPTDLRRWSSPRKLHWKLSLPMTAAVAVERRMRPR